MTNKSNSRKSVPPKKPTPPKTVCIKEGTRYPGEPSLLEKIQKWTKSS